MCLSHLHYDTILKFAAIRDHVTLFGILPLSLSIKLIYNVLCHYAIFTPLSTASVSMAVASPPPHHYMNVMRRMSSKIIRVLPINELIPYMFDKMVLPYNLSQCRSREDEVKCLLNNVEEGIKVRCVGISSLLDFQKIVVDSMFL